MWLNEAQLYLDVSAPGVGEQVAAGLRELLRAQSPILVLASLWPQYWDLLTSRPRAGTDAHAQARELLDGHDITVPSAFTRSQLEQLDDATDLRLTEAADGAADGQVIQYLAGVPELLARYRNAAPGARAIIHAAMDARRLGMGPSLRAAFLGAAAHSYLNDHEWDQLPSDWLKESLAYAAAPAKGVSGPLTQLRSRPGDENSSTDPAYLLADYLDQLGRRERREQTPPSGSWAAAVSHADRPDLARMSRAAHDRGLYRISAKLEKQGAVLGDTHAAARLVDELLGPSRRR